MQGIPRSCTPRSYLGNKYHALPWEKYAVIKLDASNLIESNVKSALTDLAIYKPLEALYFDYDEVRQLIIKYQIKCA